MFWSAKPLKAQMEIAFLSNFLGEELTLACPTANDGIRSIGRCSALYCMPLGPALRTSGARNTARWTHDPFDGAAPRRSASEAMADQGWVRRVAAALSMGGKTRKNCFFKRAIHDYGSGIYKGFDSTPPQPAYAVLAQFVHSKTVEIRPFPPNEGYQVS